jgi:hypothetical protein
LTAADCGERALNAQNGNKMAEKVAARFEKRELVVPILSGEVQDLKDERCRFSILPGLSHLNIVSSAYKKEFVRDFAQNNNPKWLLVSCYNYLLIIILYIIFFHNA